MSKQEEILLRKQTNETKPFSLDVNIEMRQQQKTDKPAMPVQKKAPVIPMLKTGNLGLSTLTKENGMTAEEMDV